MVKTRRIDAVDLKILKILQKDARTSNAEIARRVDLAASAVHERIKKLEQRGVLLGYASRIDPVALDLHVTAFVFVRTRDRVGELSTAEELAAIPQAQEVHHIAGEDCYLVKLRAADNQELGRLLRERIGVLPGVDSSRTTIVMETVKETPALPLEGGDEE